MFETWILRLYVLFFLIAWVCCAHWALAAWRLHRGYMREHGIWKGILNFSKAFRHWPAVKRVWRETPGAKVIWTRAAILFCVVSLIQGLMMLYSFFVH